jgi:hypothetical protein
LHVQSRQRGWGQWYVSADSSDVADHGGRDNLRHGHGDLGIAVEDDVREPDRHRDHSDFLADIQPRDGHAAGIARRDVQSGESDGYKLNWVHR